MRREEKKIERRILDTMLWNIANTVTLAPGQRVAFTIPGNPDRIISGIVRETSITANYASYKDTVLTSDLNITLENLTFEELQSENRGA